MIKYGTNFQSRRTLHDFYLIRSGNIKKSD